MKTEWHHLKANLADATSSNHLHTCMKTLVYQASAHILTKIKSKVGIARVKRIKESAAEDDGLDKPRHHADF